MNRFVASLAVMLLAACPGETPEEVVDPDAECGGCEDGQVCDPSRKTCVAALGEGQACEARSDGALCDHGLVCGSVVGGARRCSRDCTASDAARVCGAGGKCYARPGATGGSVGFCGVPAGDGAACGVDGLAVCDSGLVCVTPTTSAGAGKCFPTCDPAAPSCAGGRSCASPFSDPAVGICVAPPGGYPERCDYTTLTYCGQGETCVRPTSASWGYCHKKCSEAAPCAAGACVQPVEGVRFCVAPVARCTSADARQCARCSWIEDQYCADEDICVQVGEATVCKADCTGGPERCPEGTSCSVLTGSASKACL